MDTDVKKVEAEFLLLLESVIPRILTQSCRDKTSPDYGCFDRNYWHYRIRDFASVILQQGAYCVLCASKALQNSPVTEDYARDIARGACAFWKQRARMHGAFEEYYPFENGYPPLAFSTLAIAKLVAIEKIADPQILKSGFKIAARQLLSRFEGQAANQQIAGLAALAWISKIFPEFVPKDRFDDLARKTAELQNKEGWFVEYGGPDLGYLSVSLDCLWDLYDATGDKKYVEFASKALRFIFVSVSFCSAGLGILNARNTDYLVPYGICRFFKDGAPPEKEMAKSLLISLFSHAGSAAHFFSSIDDRYWCHYIGHSVARAALVLRATPPDGGPCEKSPALPDSCYYEECGYYFRKFNNGISLVIALKKGGSLKLCGNGKLFLDLGWLVKCNRVCCVTHWQSNSWRVAKNEYEKFVVSGGLARHAHISIGPFKHECLRFASFFLGRKIISTLKNKLIFKKQQTKKFFIRKIIVTDSEIKISDEIKGCDGEKIIPAARVSKRHVASADCFHNEDVSLEHGFNIQKSVSFENGVFHSETVVRFNEDNPSGTETDSANIPAGSDKNK